MDNKIIIFHILEFTECGMKKNARMPPNVNVIEAIGELLSRAPLSLEKIPDIENPFRIEETEINLDAVASLNMAGAAITGADLMSGQGLNNVNLNGSPTTLPFENQNQDQKQASGKKAGFGGPGDITFPG